MKNRVTPSVTAPGDITLVTPLFRRIRSIDGSPSKTISCY